MTDNEKLIDAAEAMTADEIHQHPMAALDKLRALARELRAAEKAHTPTDDEREARLEYVIDAAVPVDEFPSWRFRYSRLIADAVRAAGFHRSEAPGLRASEKIEWPDHWTTNEKLRDLHARWHDQKGNLLGREACGWEACEFWDSAQFTLRLADVHIAGREPQGEPSDLVRRLIDLRGDMRHNADEVATLDAAITALSEPQGESIDVAQKVMSHVYRGACPDPVEGWDRRDPGCAACRALTALSVQGEPSDAQVDAAVIKTAMTTSFQMPSRERTDEARDS